MKRWIMAVLLMAGLVVACGDSGASGATDKPKCDKACQRANDHFVPPDHYTDFFVNDSDGDKDMVFAVYHEIPFPTAGGDVRCDVLKSFDAEGVGIAVVCPPGEARVIGASSAQSNNDEDDDG